MGRDGWIERKYWRDTGYIKEPEERKGKLASLFKERVTPVQWYINTIETVETLQTGYIKL